MKYFTVYQQIMQSEIKTAEYESYKNSTVGRTNEEWLAISGRSALSEESSKGNVRDVGTRKISYLI